MITTSDAPDLGRTAATALRDDGLMSAQQCALHDCPTPTSRPYQTSSTAIEGFAITNGDVPVLISEEQLEPLVRKLRQGDFSTYDSEDLMAQLRSRLTEGDSRIANQMAALVLAYGNDPAFLEAQCLAVEVLAAARAPHFGSLIFNTLRRSLESTIPDLQFAAVAAASDLGRYQQNLLGPIVRQVAEASASANVKTAAEALLRRIYGTATSGQ
jgi:hypothetical protein